MAAGQVGHLWNASRDEVGALLRQHGCDISAAINAYFDEQINGGEEADSSGDSVAGRGRHSSEVQASLQAPIDEGMKARALGEAERELVEKQHQVVLKQQCTMDERAKQTGLVRAEQVLEVVGPERTSQLAGLHQGLLDQAKPEFAADAQAEHKLADQYQAELVEHNDNKWVELGQYKPWSEGVDHSGAPEQSMVPSAALARSDWKGPPKSFITEAVLPSLPVFKVATGSVSEGFSTTFAAEAPPPRACTWAGQCRVAYNPLGVPGCMPSATKASGTASFAGAAKSAQFAREQPSPTRPAECHRSRPAYRPSNQVSFFTAAGHSGATEAGTDEDNEELLSLLLQQ